MIHGIDYYSGNGSPSLAGLSFAFIKATEGLRGTDPAYAAQRARIRKAGLAFGAYHFGWENENLEQQAEHFVTVAEPEPGDMLFLDFEGYPDGRNWSGMSWAQRDAWRLAWIAKVKALTGGRCRVGTYVNTSTWKLLPSDDPGDFLFIAQYTSAAAPDISHPWQFWQHTSTPLDQDYGNFPSRDALDAWRHLGTVTDSVEDDLTPAQAQQLTTIEQAVTGHGIASAGYRLLDQKTGKSTEAGAATDVHQVWNDTAEGVTTLLQHVSALAAQVNTLSQQVTALAKQVTAPKA